MSSNKKNKKSNYKEMSYYKKKKKKKILLALGYERKKIRGIIEGSPEGVGRVIACGIAWWI